MTVPYYSEAEALEKLPNIRVIKSALRSAFTGLHTQETVQPPQTIAVLPEDKGDCIFYPGILDKSGLIGVKLSPYLAARSAQGLYPVTAYTLIMSATSGEPLLICDSLMLTTVRTAATTALALDYLTPPNAKKLAVIGGGKIACYHLRYVSQQHDWSEVSVYSPTLANPAADGHAAKKSLMLAEYKDAKIEATAEAAVADADVVLLCTSSGTAVIEDAWLKQDVTVTSISTNAKNAHEIDPSTLSSYNVFCDYRQTAPLSAGEMVIAKEKHGWTADQITADLPELIAGQHGGTKTVSGKTFFRSIGLGLEDLAIASVLLENSN